MIPWTTTWREDMPGDEDEEDFLSSKPHCSSIEGYVIPNRSARAPDTNNGRTTSIFPKNAAPVTGGFPHLSTIFGSAPCLSSSCNVSSWLEIAARCSGDALRLSRIFTSARLSIRKRATSVWPDSAAACNGALKLLYWLLTFTDIIIPYCKLRMASILPSAAYLSREEPYLTWNDRGDISRAYPRMRRTQTGYSIPHASMITTSAVSYVLSKLVSFANHRKTIKL
mmetsp:Transcript_15180/g.21104  ORF Transcript_15180/g.21104 Transcript_15180/m.21104 type:complete len:225 (+) Transcript_15180:490-1164(+)